MDGKTRPQPTVKLKKKVINSQVHNPVPKLCIINVYLNAYKR